MGKYGNFCFGKSEFYPKIFNFCQNLFDYCEPTKEGKNPYNLYLPNKIALKTTVDFLEMPTPMEESLSLLVRLDVKPFFKMPLVYIHDL